MLFDALLLLSVEVILVYVLVETVAGGVQRMFLRMSGALLLSMMERLDNQNKNLKRVLNFRTINNFYANADFRTDNYNGADQQAFLDRPSIGLFLLIVTAFACFLYIACVQLKRCRLYASLPPLEFDLPSTFLSFTGMLVVFLSSLYGIQQLAINYMFKGLSEIIIRNVRLVTMGFLSFEEGPVPKGKCRASVLDFATLLQLFGFIVLSAVLTLAALYRTNYRTYHAALGYKRRGLLERVPWRRVAAKCAFHLLSLASPFLCLASLGMIMPSPGQVMYYVDDMTTMAAFGAEVYARKLDQVYYESTDPLPSAARLPFYRSMLQRLSDRNLTDPKEIGKIIRDRIQDAWHTVPAKRPSSHLHPFVRRVPFSNQSDPSLLSDPAALLSNATTALNASDPLPSKGTPSGSGGADGAAQQQAGKYEGTAGGYAQTGSGLASRETPPDTQWVQRDVPPLVQRTRILWSPIAVVGGLGSLACSLFILRDLYRSVEDSSVRSWYFTLRLFYLLTMGTIYGTFASLIHEHPQFCKSLVYLQPKSNAQLSLNGFGLGLAGNQNVTDLIERYLTRLNSTLSQGTARRRLLDGYDVGISGDLMDLIIE